MKTKKKPTPRLGFGVAIIVLVLGLLTGLAGDVNTARAMRLQSGVAPVVVPDVYKYIENTTLIIAASGVLTNDYDPDIEDIEAVPVTGGQTFALGNYTLLADGSFTYDPPTDYSGDDSFTYRATDLTDTRMISPSTKVTLVTNYPPNS